MCLSQAARSFPKNEGYLFVGQNNESPIQEDFKLNIKKDLEIKRRPDILKNDPDLSIKRTSFDLQIKDIEQIQNH